MTRLKSHADKSVADVVKHSGEVVTNFMGGNSYKLNPMDTLKIVSASSIFGEPSYYRDGIGSKSTGIKSSNKSTADVMTEAIDNALDFDFLGTLNFAKELRSEYMMRMNPAVIFIRAAIHKDRVKFNEANPGVMKEVCDTIVNRPDDITNQFEYYMFVNGTKNNLPGIVKRSWADRLSKFNRYSISKYQTKGRIRDLVRISHAHSEVIDELMKTDGVLVLEEDNTTWERLRSDGKSWKEILKTIKVPHMALLRNIRGIFSEIDDLHVAKEVSEQLVNGVAFGKQFPFRYYSAYKAIASEGAVNHKGLLLDTLCMCMDVAMENFPKLKGKTMCLSDNSGSAWRGLTSEYGSTVVAEIDNLSSFMTSINSEEGYVGYFGDKLEIIPVSKRDGVLSQVEKADNAYGLNSKGYVGASTENGIWIFFRDAIANKVHYDNIFIYSDMQAGHGGLYGTSEGQREYKAAGFGYKTNERESGNVDVLKLVTEYRKIVNPKVNLFSVQTAGYNNSVLPENLYRSSILTGWTGKEALYADVMIKIWDGIEKRDKQ